MDGIDADWNPFEDGATLHGTGSEGGEILRDDEHALGARITLERGGQTAPFAITCGIYGWMMHTRFFGGETEADEEYDSMRAAMGALLTLAADDCENSSAILMSGIDEFVRNYP